MKKLVDLLLVCITFIILYFLQANFFNWFTIFDGIKPNLFIIFALFLGLFLKRKIGFTLGIIFGLCLDLFSGRILGLNAIILAVAGLIGERLDRSFSKEIRITLMLMTIFTTFICESLSYIILTINGSYMAILSFIKIILIEMLYNAIIVIIFYPIIQIFGVKLEEDFTLKDTFIKYF